MSTGNASFAKIADRGAQSPFDPMDNVKFTKKVGKINVYTQILR
jgi:hypothetical protein